MLQSTFSADDTFLSSLAKTLLNLAVFTGCNQADIVHADPTSVRDELQKRTRVLLQTASES